MFNSALPLRRRFDPFLQRFGKAGSMQATVLVAGSFGLSKIAQLASNLILARILFPEAFGLMALVTVFITGLDLINDMGVKPSIVRSKRGDDPEFLATCWTLMVVRGFWITALAWLLAWPYSALYEEGMLFAMICVGAVSSIFKGFTSIEPMVRSRHLDLKKVVTWQLASQVLSACFTVLFAWLTGSVWGLVFGMLSGTLIGTILSHLILPSQNHRFRWNKDVLSEILVFGRWILLGTLFTYLGGQGIKAVQGTLITAEMLGYIHIAGMFGWMIGDLVARIIGDVAYPVMSRVVRERPHDLSRMVFRIRLIQVLCTTPIFIGLALLSPLLIGTLYDDRYTVVATFLTVMALNNGISVLPMVYQNVVLSLGESRIHAMVQGTASGLKIASTFAGYYIAGPVGMVMGNGIVSLVILVWCHAIAAKRGFASTSIDIVSVAVLLLAALLILPTLNWKVGS